MICRYIESLYYHWKYRNYKGPLSRSKVYEDKVKELLLKDLKAMEFKKVI